MGKGQGRGKGKGGCGVAEAGCDALHGMICCVLLFLIIGPVLIAVGIGFIASATRNDRKERIDDVKQSVRFWESDTTNGVVGYKQPKLTAQLNTSGCNGGYALNTTIALVATSLPADVFTDRSFTYEQLRYMNDPAGMGLAYPSTRDVVGDACSIHITILSGSQKIGSINRSFYESRMIDVSQQGGHYCPTSYSSRDRDVRNCKANCDEFGGTFTYGPDFGWRCVAMLSIEKLCIRITAQGDPAQPSSWTEESAQPAPSEGCYNQRGLNPDSNFRFSPALLTAAQPSAFTIEVRSSHDPWLKYLQVTGGSGSFGLKTSQKLSVGFSCLIVGLAISSFWFISCFCCWRYGCGYRNQQRPAGYVGGFYYDAYNRYASRLWGAQPQQAGNYPVVAGYPTAQPHDPRFAQPYQPYGAPVPPGGPPQANFPPSPQPLYAGQQGGYPPQQQPYPAPGVYHPPGVYLQPQGQYPPAQAGQGQYPSPQGQYGQPQGQYGQPQGQYAAPPQGQYTLQSTGQPASGYPILPSNMGIYPPASLPGQGQPPPGYPKQ